MSPKHSYEYDDSYLTCVETYSSLIVFSDDLTPDNITKLLKIEPTATFQKGERFGRGKLQRKTNGWFYCTKKMSPSKDTRRHIDLILKALDGKADSIRKLHRKSSKIQIISYWSSVGQGGPWLMPQQMLKLGKLNIDIWWDVYFAGEDET